MMLQKDCLTGKSFANLRDESIIKTGVGRYIELFQSRVVSEKSRNFTRNSCGEI